MQIDLHSLSSDQRYHLLTQVIVPRPIAWVLTDNGRPPGEQTSAQPHGLYNLAPFSWFNSISSDPALVMLSIGDKPSGEVKDTRRNILQSKYCVIHIPSVEHAAAVTDSAASLPHGESEIDRLNLSLVKQEGWPLPRLALCKVALACEFYAYQEIGTDKQGLIFCEVKKIHIDDSAVQQSEKRRIKVDAQVLNPLARLGANEYATFGQVFRLDRPK